MIINKSLWIAKSNLVLILVLNIMTFSVSKFHIIKNKHTKLPTVKLLWHKCTVYGTYSYTHYTSLHIS